MHNEPMIIANIWPPIIFLGLAVIFFGMAKTVNVDAPMAATIIKSIIVE